MVGQYYDRSQPCECCSSLSFRGRNRKCWVWNYFRCSHCRVYRINWYNDAKKKSREITTVGQYYDRSQTQQPQRREPEMLNLKFLLPVQLPGHCRHYRINWYNNNAAVVSSELFIFWKEKNSWNHHKEGTHRKILTRKIKNTRKHNTPYYYLLDAFVYLLNNCCDTQFINFSASNWKKMIHELNVIREK